MATTTNPYEQEQAALKRRERLVATMMQMQGAQVPLQHYGPLNALGEVARAYAGGRAMGRVDEQQAELAGRMATTRSEGMRKVADAISKRDLAALTDASGSYDPDVAAAAMQGVTQIAKPRDEPADIEAYKLWEGQGGKGGYAGYLRFKAGLNDSTATKGKTKLLTPEEVKAAGLPVGTVAERDADGNTKVVHKVSDTTQNRTEGRETLDTLVSELNGYYDDLERGGGITSTDKGGLENVGAGIASSGVGQAAGRLFGTQNQSTRNKIAQIRPLLLQAIKSATGMTAKQMDSNVELKLYLAVATDPQLDVQTNRNALNAILKLYGTPQAEGEPPATATAEFATEAEAEAAAQAGRIKPGDKIKVGGKGATWQ